MRGERFFAMIRRRRRFQVTSGVGLVFLVFMLGRMSVCVGVGKAARADGEECRVRTFLSGDACGLEMSRSRGSRVMYQLLQKLRV